MKCPNCSFEQPEGLADCQKCQVIFAKLAPRQSSSIGSQTFSSPAVTESKSNFTQIIWMALGLGLVALVVWGYFSGRGQPVPEGAYQNDLHHFALLAPQGWTTVTQENFQQTAQQLGDRFPASLKSSMEHGNVAVAFVKMMTGGGPAASVNVVVINYNLPRISESTKSEAVKEISKALSSILEDYKVESADIMKVDNLNSLGILSRGTAKVETMPSGFRPGSYVWSPAVYNTMDMKFMQVMVPGSGRGYIITCVSDAGSFPVHIDNFNDFLNSFRVLERPSFLGLDWGEVFSRGLMRGLIYAVVIFAIGFFRRMFS